jgi:DNA polymerase III delta prime subunit
MVDEKIIHNARDLKAELGWFREILKTRSRLNAGEETQYKDVYDISPPQFNGSSSTYARFVKKYELGFETRFLLILAMVPHIKPELLDVFLAKNQNTQQIFTEFGGKKGKNHLGFLPTGETAMFILAGSDLKRRFAIQRAFDVNHLFRRENILWLEDMESGEPRLSGALQISKEVLDLLTIGELRKPDFSAEFPAKLLTTKMDWDDLVLASKTLEQLDEIEIWIRNHHTLRKDWGMEKKLKPGYKALFYGPPGTGKTLTATLLGKKTGRDVYRIDLSQTVSKYIGETEKNLSNIFERAENKEWILFFDEADALFGNRTSTKDAHDRYANQQVSYLLQRIEDYNGLVILASNLKNNIDNAFLRRLQAMIHFPVPSYGERLELWQQGFSNAIRLESEIDLQAIAKEYEIPGGTIINVVQHSSLKALGRDSNKIRLNDIIDGIKREFHKSRRTI